MVKKTALSSDKKGVPVSWTSKFGSATFNQYGREFPLSGMNEKGLGVEILWLGATQYPKADHRKTVSELQWVQYQLDNFESVNEVVDHVNDIRIAPFEAKVHFLVCDALKECATVEFLNGEAAVHRTGKDLPIPLLTNDTYEKSTETLKNYLTFGGPLEIPTSMTSLDRFVRAAFGMKNQSVGVDSAFKILGTVKQGPYSVWNAVYNLKTRQISFRTHLLPKVRSFDASAFDYACSNPVMMYDIQRDLEGDVTQSFEVYSASANDLLVKKSFEGLGGVKEMLGEAVKDYPASTECKE